MGMCRNGLITTNQLVCLGEVSAWRRQMKVRKPRMSAYEKTTVDIVIMTGFLIALSDSCISTTTRL
jgi:hypothetical protein